MAYELELPPVMAIHPVVSIAQLEPAPPENDPYGRTRNIDPPPVAAENDEAPEYEIERLVGKRTVRNRLQYLVKWKGYGNEHNVWYSVTDLTGAQQSINNYEERNRHVPPPRRQRRRERQRDNAQPERLPAQPDVQPRNGRFVGVIIPARARSR